ncbi:hypothetical protein FACS189445_4830 [Spirochaetia bacterium]|nr:hypothetical protein FACS189445_4830 [Spirochaetia bacterium]
MHTPFDFQSEEKPKGFQNTINFLVYCIESYKSAKHYTGKQVISLFTRYGVLDYIIDCAGALHTTGEQYIIQDIDEYIAAKTE